MNKETLIKWSLPAASVLLVGLLALQVFMLVSDGDEDAQSAQQTSQGTTQSQENTEEAEELLEEGLQEAAQTSLNPGDFDTLDPTGVYEPEFSTQSRHVGDDYQPRGILYRVSYEDFSILISTDEEIQDSWVGDGWSYELLADDPMWNPGGCASMPTAVVGDFIFTDDSSYKSDGTGSGTFTHFVTRYDTRPGTANDKRYGFFAVNDPSDSSSNHPVIRGLQSSGGSLEMIFELDDSSSIAKLQRISRLIAPEQLSYQDTRTVFDQSLESAVTNPIATPVRGFLFGSSVYTDSITALNNPGITKFFNDRLVGLVIEEAYVMAETASSVIAAPNTRGAKSLTAFNKATNAPVQLFDESVQTSFGAFLFPLENTN